MICCIASGLYRLENQAYYNSYIVQPPVDDGSAAQENEHAPALGSAHPPDRLLALYQSVINQLKDEDITFAEWLVFIFEPKRGAAAKDLRKQHFWRHQDTVRQLLNSWTHSHQTKVGRDLVVAWAIDFVGSRMRTEAQQITSAGILRSSNKTIGPDYLRTFKISNMKQTIQENCSTSTKVLMAMAGVESSRSTLTEAPVSAQNVSPINPNISINRA